MGQGGWLLLAGVGLASCVVAAPLPVVPCEWTRLAIDGGGFVTGIALDPVTPRRVYCFSDKGGVHRSEDGGLTWTLRATGFDREAFYSVAGMLVDDRNPGRVYVASGQAGWESARRNPNTSGLWRSDDHGDHWRLLTSRIPFSGEGTTRFVGNFLAFDPTDHNTLFVASYNQGLWVTRDAGTNWSLVGLSGRILTGVWVDPDDRGRLLVGARPEKPGAIGGLWESRDAGGAWHGVFTNSAVWDVSRHPTNRNWLAAALNEKDVFLSRDRGATWTPLTLHPDCKRVRKLRWHPGRPHRLWTVGGDRGVFYTDDFGEHWHWPTTDIAASFRYPPEWFMSARKADWTAMPDVLDLQISPDDPNRLYAAANVTPLVSTDGGETWESRPHGINVVCVYQIVCDPVDPQTLYVCNADEGLVKSTDGGRSFFWPVRAGEFSVNETHQLWINPHDNRHLALAVTLDWKNPHWTRVGISHDGGESWWQRGEGLPGKEGGWLPGLAVLDEEGQTVMASFSGSNLRKGGVFLSRDGGVTWSACNEGLEGETSGLVGSGWGPKPSLAAVGGRVYFATRRGLYTRSAVDRPWERLGRGVLPDALRTVAVATNRPESVWVGSEGGLFVSHDLGRTFQRVGTDAMQWCQGVAVDPFDPRRWFVAVSNPSFVGGVNVPGVYMTADDGATWRLLAPMPCEGVAWRVTADPHRRNVIYVGTNGVGAWRGEIADDE
jgi:photosystem II stability/assembly factor-like uncharacterized protein